MFMGKMQVKKASQKEKIKLKKKEKKRGRK
jgi:hypothetical protein